MENAIKTIVLSATFWMSKDTLRPLLHTPTRLSHIHPVMTMKSFNFLHFLTVGLSFLATTPVVVAAPIPAVLDLDAEVPSAPSTNVQRCGDLGLDVAIDKRLLDPSRYVKRSADQRLGVATAERQSFDVGPLDIGLYKRQLTASITITAGLTDIGADVSKNRPEISGALRTRGVAVGGLKETPDGARSTFSVSPHGLNIFEDRDTARRSEHAIGITARDVLVMGRGIDGS